MNNALRAHLKRVEPDVREGSITLEPGQLEQVVASAAYVATAEVDGEIRAFAECRPNPLSPYRWTMSFAVERDWQKRGLGMQVVSDAMRFCEESGAEYVDGALWAHNLGALAMHKRFGSELVGRINDVYRRDGISYDQIIVVRKCNQ